MGETRRAITFYEQALAIAREIGDRNGEAHYLGCLGNGYASLGQNQYAIKNFEQAIAVSCEIGHRFGEGWQLGSLADIFIDENRYNDAIERAKESVKIGTEIESNWINSYHNNTLALAHLYSGNLSAARAAIDAASKFDVPENNHNVAALLGIIALRQAAAGKREAFAPSNLKSPDASANASPLRDAINAFTAAIEHADKLLAQTPELYDALDAKGIALCGLAMCETVETPRRGVSTEDAVATFRAARKINRDAGIVACVVRLLDALALADPNGLAVLSAPRQAAGGE